MPNKKNLHIVDSYKVWRPLKMWAKIQVTVWDVYRRYSPEKLLNRPWISLYVEWWAHNIGYYLTLPLCHIPYFKALNKRFKDIDLEEWQ